MQDNNTSDDDDDDNEEWVSSSSSLSCFPSDACELTLDPNTAHRHLSLSEDNRKVTWDRGDLPCPDHPERFDYRCQVLCREALTGRCYWEVQWEGGISIGVTYRGITRKGGYDSRNAENKKSWILSCHDDKYVDPVDHEDDFSGLNEEDDEVDYGVDDDDDDDDDDDEPYYSARYNGVETVIDICRTKLLLGPMK